MVFSIGIAPVLVTTLLSEAYLPAAVIFQVAVAGQILMNLMGGGAHADILLSSERHRTVRTLRISAGVTNVVLNLVLIPIWGGLGAALATGVAAVGLVIAEYWAARRLLRLTLPGRAPAAMLGASIAAGLAVWWIPLSGWAYLVTTTVGFLVAFCLLGWMLKPYDAEDEPILRRAGKPLDRLVRFLSSTS
jgi:O-antigen/teichoic acid export membrane protein